MLLVPSNRIKATSNKNERQQSIADFLLFNITGCHENMREKIMLEGMLF